VVLDWDFPSERMVDILLAALAFSVMISFLIGPHELDVLI
jgi:hypothetical protein